MRCYEVGGETKEKEEKEKEEKEEKEEEEECRSMGGVENLL